MDFHLEYESFSFDPIFSDLLFKLDDNILPVEYESFSFEFETHGSSNDRFYADMSPSLLNPSKLTSFFITASLILLSLRSLPLRLLL